VQKKIEKIILAQFDLCIAILKMQTLNNMFDARNPDNLIESKKECARCCNCAWVIIAYILAIVGLIVAAEYAGTYLLFGFVIAGSPDNNRVSGCLNNVSACPGEPKMLCYQDDMSVCYKLGLVVFAVVLIGLIVILMVLCFILVALYYLLATLCYLFKGIYTVFNKIITSYKVASNMTENNQNNFDIASLDLSENNVEIDIENVSIDANVKLDE